MPTQRTDNHQPSDQAHEDHIRNTQTPGVRDVLPKNVLPRTDVPDYLSESPLQEQSRHLDSFHRNQPQANHAGDNAAFSRPGLADNLKLIQDNLADDTYFQMPWRAEDTRQVTTGDGTPDSVTDVP